MADVEVTLNKAPTPLAAKISDYVILTFLLFPLFIPRTLTFYEFSGATYLKAGGLFTFVIAVLFVKQVKLSISTLFLSIALILGTMIVSAAYGTAIDLNYLFLYALFFLIFALRQFDLFNDKNVPAFGFALVIFLSLACYFFPESVGNTFVWNTTEQHDYFVSSGKIVGIFGLHSTAGYGYGIIALWFLSRPLSLLGSFCILASIALLVSLRSTSAMVSLIFISGYLTFLFSRRKFHLSLLLILLIVGLFCFYWLYSNIGLQSENLYKSFVNRYSERGIFGQTDSEPLGILGFSKSDSYTFSDSGYLDHFFRFGLFGVVLYYFMFSKFIFDNCSNKLFALFLCFFLLTHEAGHTYSKSVFFSSLWILAVTSSGRADKQIRNGYST